MICRDEEQELLSEKFYVDRLRKQRAKIEELKADYEAMQENLRKKDQLLIRCQQELKTGRLNQEYRLRYEKLAAAMPGFEAQYRQLLDQSVAMRQHIEGLQAERRCFPKEGIIKLQERCQQLTQEVQSLQQLILQLQDSQEDYSRARRKAERALVEEQARHRDEIDKVKQQNNRLQGLLDIRHSQATDFPQIYQLEEQLARYRSVLAAQRQHKDQLLAEWHLLEEKFRLSEQQILGLTSQLNRCRSGLQSTADTLKRKKRDQILLKENCVALENQCERRAEEILTQKEWQIRELSDSLRDARSIIQQLTDQSKQTSRDLQRLSARNAQLQTQLSRQIKQRESERVTTDEVMRMKRDLEARRLTEADKIDELFNELIR